MLQRPTLFGTAVDKANTQEKPSLEEKITSNLFAEFVIGAKFISSGHFVLVTDGNIHLFESKSFTHKALLTKGGLGQIVSLVLDNGHVVYGDSGNKTLKIIDVINSKTIKEKKLDNGYYLTALTSLRDGSIVCCFSSKYIQILDPNLSLKCEYAFSSDISCAAVQSNENIIFGSTKGIYCLNTQTGTIECVNSHQDANQISVLVNDDIFVLPNASRSLGVQGYILHGKDFKYKVTLEPIMTAATVTENGDILASSECNSLILISGETGKIVNQSQFSSSKYLDYPIAKIAYNATDNIMLFSSADGRIGIYKLHGINYNNCPQANETIRKQI